MKNNMTDTLYDNLDKYLYKLKSPIVVTDANPDGTSNQIGSLVVTSDYSIVDNPDATSGSISGNLEYVGGYIQSGNFVTGSTGWKLSSDGSFEGSTGTFRGNISIGSGNSIFKADSNGIYLGNATFATAPFRVTTDGRVTANDLRIVGGSFDSPVGYATLAGNAFYSGGWKAIGGGMGGYLDLPNDGGAAFQFYADFNEVSASSAFSMQRVFVGYGTIGSPVNWIAVVNSLTAVNPYFYPEGTDANIGITIKPKGSGITIIEGVARITSSISIGGTINANAVLDVQSTTKAFMPPRMTTTQRDNIASPTAGMVLYNSTTNKLNVYTTAWEAVTSA